MGDMAEDFKFLQEEKRKRHSEWHKLNMAVLERDGIEKEIKNQGLTVIIRARLGKPQVDFFPSTGRWWARGKTFSGGAKAMLKWYDKQ